MGIRTDIKNIIEKVLEAKATATRAHERIDEHIKDYHRNQ
jgi:outer membrane murein-binding lipoprotein Lpp